MFSGRRDGGRLVEGVQSEPRWRLWMVISLGYVFRLYLLCSGIHHTHCEYYIFYEGRGTDNDGLEIVRMARVRCSLAGVNSDPKSNICW